MEGEGPTSGRPIALGLILASRDALSLDQIVCDLLSLPRRSLMTNRVAQEQGIGKRADRGGWGEMEKSESGISISKSSGTDWNLPGF